MLLLAAVAAASPCVHMPTSRVGDAAAPAALGDVTDNSWAVCGTMLPGEVFYYSMDVPALRGREEDRLWFGAYGPGCAPNASCADLDYTFRTAIWGMPNTTQCAAWGDGWGAAATAEPAGYQLPGRVVRAGTPFLQERQHIVLRAPPTPRQPAKFEPFTPTAFTPRGSCVAEFPSAGTYHLAVWGDDAQDGERRWCVGVGLAERDVYSPVTLLLSSFVVWSVQRWNRWAVWELAWPYAATLAALVAYSAVRRTRGRQMSLAAGALLAGSAVSSATMLAWSLRVCAGGAGAALLLPLVLRIALPAAVAYRALAYDPSRTPLEPLVLGALAAALGAGFVLAPLLLIFAAVGAADSGAGRRAAQQRP